MSKGQFYDSEEEESGDVGLCAKLQFQNVVDKDSLCFDRALLVINDIGKVFCEALIAHLKLGVIAKLTLGNEVVTEIFADVTKSGNSNGFILIVNRVNLLPVEIISEWFDVVNQYNIKKWFLVDGLSRVNLPHTVMSVSATNANGLRIAKGSSYDVFEETVLSSITVSELESGVIIQGPCAHVVNYCDVRRIPCVSIFVIRDAAFTVEAAERLELVWKWFECYVGSLDGIEKPLKSAYSAQRERDPFLVNTDSLYS